MRFQGVLFDLDGTVLDTSALIVRSFKHAFWTHYRRDIEEKTIYQYFGKTLRCAMEELGPDKTDALIDTYRAHNMAHHDAAARVFDGVPETLRRLCAAGVKLAVVTSKTRETALRGLQLFQLDACFAAVLGAGQSKEHKPHPEPVYRALEQLGLAAPQCLMVGDSPADLISAKRAGVKTAAVRWSNVDWNLLAAEEPDFILETMPDLIGVCG